MENLVAEEMCCFECPERSERARETTAEEMNDPNSSPPNVVRREKDPKLTNFSNS